MTCTDPGGPPDFDSDGYRTLDAWDDFGLDDDEKQ